MFCPKCGVTMTPTRDGSTLECVPGQMELSVALRDQLAEVFVHRRRHAESIDARLGGAWFCPGCGMPMTEGEGGVRCPRCGELLGRAVFALIELHPHR